MTTIDSEKQLDSANAEGTIDQHYGINNYSYSE